MHRRVYLSPKEGSDTMQGKSKGDRPVPVLLIEGAQQAHMRGAFEGGGGGGLLRGAVQEARAGRLRWHPRG